MIAIASLALVAAAQPKPIEQADIESRYSDSYTECTRDALATADTVFCVVTESKAQEPKLDEALAAALKALPAKRKTALRLAQAAWRRGAAAKCDQAIADEQFERVAQAKRGQCMLDETIRRTLELERSRSKKAAMR
jgi:uncharacterized protein YecT (DUF1311 family)